MWQLVSLIRHQLFPYREYRLFPLYWIGYTCLPVCAQFRFCLGTTPRDSQGLLLVQHTGITPEGACMSLLDAKD